MYNETQKSFPEKIKLSPGDTIELASGQFRIEKELGRGGFAHVYAIRNRRGDVFAIKIMDLWSVRPDEYDELIRKFGHEFYTGRVQSSSIVRSYFTGFIEGNPYIIMDYCPNGSLARRIKEFGDPAQFTTLAIHILEGLRALHIEGIIHRDLKPENILFDVEDNPRLTDFGIAGHLNSRLTTRNLVGMVRQVWGTPLYSPPEQLSHQKAYKHTSPAMDIFAFGVLMYEVISGGHHPFGDHSELVGDADRYLSRVNQKKIIPLVQYNQKTPPVWIRVIDKCLEPKPQNRFGRVEEIIGMVSSKRALPIQQDYTHFTSTGPAVLKVMEGDMVGQVYYLSVLMEDNGKNILTVGWEDPDDPGQNDIELTEKETRYISRKHATILCHEGRWQIMDGQTLSGNGSVEPSRNGTYINYEPLKTGMGEQLKHGDIISIGNVRLKFILL